MPFVRQAELTDLKQLAVFDEWRQATEESIRAGVVHNLADLPELIYFKVLNSGES